MDIVFSGITAQATDHGDFNKFVKIVTPNGVKRCLIKGVKKPTAKLKACAMPFAFYEFTAVKNSKDAVPIITGASQIEDLFLVAHDADKHLASSLMLEGAMYSFADPCEEFFVYLLRRLKDVIYSQSHPFLASIRFFQHVIHQSGYSYDYQKFDGLPTSPLALLSALSFVGDEDCADFEGIDEGLIVATLKKIVANFEVKFECNLNSKKML